MDKKGGVTVFRRKFFVLRRRKTSWANHSVFQKCSGIKIVPDNRGITILSIFLSHIAKNHRGRTLLCFRIFCYQNCSDNSVITSLTIVFVSQCRNICGEPFND